MSVIKSKRHPSKFEVIKHASELRISLTGLIVRNFGLKDTYVIARRKYRIGKELDPIMPKHAYILVKTKQKINNLASILESNVRGANTIYPTTLEECVKRRDYQNSAIVNCEQLYSELQYITTMFEVDINGFRQYVEGIDRQITLIKAWKTSDNHKFKGILAMGDI